MAVPSNWPQTIRSAGGEYLPLTAFNDEPFWRTLTFKNVDLTTATFSGGIRAAFEEASAVLQAFTFGTPTIVGADTVVSVSITEANIEALRDGVDAGAIEQLFYNIKYTPSGQPKETLLAGEFKLQGA